MKRFPLFTGHLCGEPQGATPFSEEHGLSPASLESFSEGSAQGGSGHGQAAVGRHTQQQTPCTDGLGV